MNEQIYRTPYGKQQQEQQSNVKISPAVQNMPPIRINANNFHLLANITKAASVCMYVFVVT